MPRLLRSTAAWRLSIWPTLAFAIGTAITFSIVYVLVARGIRDRSDAWLSGEADVLAQVAQDTPRDHLYGRIVGEVAELATREVPDERNAQGQKLNSVFFLEEDTDSVENPLWVGPGSDDPFRKAIHQTGITPGVPQSLTVEGWPMPFRVVAHTANGRTIFLGLSSRGMNHLLRSLSRRFILLWGGTVFIGFLIAFTSAQRTLSRVERITETVARIGTDDLAERLPEPANHDEISRLAKTFNRMLDRIQASVIELRLVTDAVAHDLKSPLTSIRGTLESALSAEPRGPWRESVAEAIENLDRLLNILNTTLDVAEGQAGALHLDKDVVDLSSVVSQVLDLYQPTLAELGHKLVADIEPHVAVEADLSLFHRVLSNLVENEVAHLPSGQEIMVRLRQHNGSAELLIADNGPGFPPEVRARAFERFVKGKDSSGHGLGLAFVDAVLRAHGGSVGIGDRDGGGALVILLLPVAVRRSESLPVAR